ncbi:MAG: diaminopimelate decarboxylase [Phycisphaerae bacterium]
MDHFRYENNVLHCEQADLRAVAEEFGTPLYVYSKTTFLEHYQRLAEAFAPLSPMICYAVKSCHNLSILKIMKEQGAAFDIVSGGELARVLEVGGDPSRAVFAGVGKTDEELCTAIEADIAWFNVESEEELENLARLAHRMGRTARAALRVNPDVDPKTHVYTTTGKRETKFGVDLDRARRVFAEFSGKPGLDLSAIHMHLGSPVNDIDPYVRSIEKTLTELDRFKADGYEIKALNIGGGFGAHYDGEEAPPASAYAEQIVPMLKDSGLQILMEPGRSIMANAGILLCRVLYNKQSGDKKFVIVDGAMTELIRPALYGSFHFAWPVEPAENAVPPTRSASLQLDGSELVDIVGPVCESGDFLAKQRWLPPVKRGDLMCIYSAGAYGSVMAHQYNSRPRAAEVLVENDQVHLIRKRENYDDLVAAERL